MLSGPLEVRHPLALQPEDAIGLGTRRDLEHDRAVQRRNTHLPADCRGIDIHRHGGAQIVAVALELRVRRDLDIDKEIAGRPAGNAGAALPRETHARARTRAGPDAGFDMPIADLNTKTRPTERLI